MKKFSDLTACLAVLQAWHSRNDMEPEQTKNIEKAIRLLKQLRRLQDPTRTEMFRYVREITDAIIKASLK